MTFSIVGRSGDGAAWGVAVASKFLAVGAAVPAAEVSVGAIATQALANLSFRPAGLSLLRRGRDARATVDALVASDEGREHRQVGVVDGQGRSATYTGAQCLAWAGGRAGADYALQGNILVGPQVVEAMEHAWLTFAVGQPGGLSARLLAALRAGDEQGGDSRGRQSAAIVVVRKGAGYNGDDVEMDLRVDDHRDPVAELQRLALVHAEFFAADSDDKEDEAGG